jgi:RNA polymerase sigma factor (TIGR02999 family)
VRGVYAASVSEQFTVWLQRVRDGDPAGWEHLIRIIWNDLRAVAHHRLRSERPHHTLGTTALVHEAFLRLAQQEGLAVENRSEFLAAASNTMRRVLVDYARRRKRLKRGGGVAAVPLEEVEDLLSEEQADEVLALDEALDRLAQAEPRAAKVVECRFYSGLSVEEVAKHLGVSEKTIQRDWILARAWLRREVAKSSSFPE